MVRIDVDQFAVQPHRSLEECDKGAKTTGIKSTHADADALTSSLGERCAGSLEKTIKKIAG